MVINSLLHKIDNFLNWRNNVAFIYIALKILMSSYKFVSYWHPHNKEFTEDSIRNETNNIYLPISRNIS